MSKVNHLTFLSERYDILIRYHFLSLAYFDVEEANELYHSKEYDFLDPILENTKLFGEANKHTWDHVDSMIVAQGTKQFPYMVTGDGIGMGGVKRFLLSIKRGVPLHWIATDSHPDKEKSEFYKWKKKTYAKRLTTKQILKFGLAEVQLIYMMDWLRFFSKETMMGYYKHGTLTLY